MQVWSDTRVRNYDKVHFWMNFNFKVIIMKYRNMTKAYITNTVRFEWNSDQFLKTSFGVALSKCVQQI